MMGKYKFIGKTLMARLKHLYGKRTPLRVIHRITTRCNLKCEFCDHQLHALEKNELSTAQIKDAMRQFAKLGTIAWGITGGEPFLRRDLPEIIHYSKELGFLTNCITNGTIANDGIISDLASDLDYLITSLEGPKEITDKIRGKGVFDRVIQTIETARKNNLPVIIAATMTREFLAGDGIRFMGKLCKEMGIRCSFQNLLLTGPYGGEGFSKAKSHIVPHDPAKEEFFKALDLIQEMKNQGYPFVNNKPWMDYVKSYMRGTLKPPPCYAGKLYCNFFEDGSLRTCQYHPVKVKESSIAESLTKLPGEFKECPCTAICYVNYNLAFSFNLPMIMDGVRNAFV
jgi:MoaA/NifB/PqqE/SkfB family radical SAM enzyme